MAPRLYTPTESAVITISPPPWAPTARLGESPARNRDLQRDGSAAVTLGCFSSCPSLELTVLFPHLLVRRKTTSSLSLFQALENDAHSCFFPPHVRFPRVISHF